jgi:rubrerythrin
MSNAIQQIFREHGNAYLAEYGDRIPFAHRKVIRAVQSCGSASNGVHLYRCAECAQLHEINASCGNRHCPVCQAGKSDEWLDRQLEKALPVNCFMITFTVPQELRRLIRSNQKVCYAALFKAASDAMKKLAKDPRFVGCDLAGFTGILHTWTRQLEYHPHVHFIVPGGGLNKDGDKWIASGTAFFVPAKPLGKIFRAKFIALLKKEGLDVPAVVWDPDWVVDCRHVGNGKRALKYLAQYVFRVAIAPSRILRVADGEVHFRYQRSGEKKWRTCTLSVFEFMRRYLQHTLPHGFTKVRHYGFLAANTKVPLQKIRELICRLYEILRDLLPEKPPPPKPVWICRACGGVVRWSEFIPCPRGVG